MFLDTGQGGLQKKGPHGSERLGALEEGFARGERGQKGKKGCASWEPANSRGRGGAMLEESMQLFVRQRQEKRGSWVGILGNNTIEPENDKKKKKLVE